jgi:hypothetical protein
MLGTIVNTAAILAGGGIGLLLKKGLGQKLSDAVMTGLALVCLYIGVSGALKGTNPLITTLSIVIGGVVGTLLNLDGGINKFAHKLETKLAKKGDTDGRFAEGFITATLLFCVGAMGVVGALNSGLSGDHSLLFTKSLLDGVSAIVFASTFGAGVLLSAVCVLVYQGAITLLASFVAPLLPAATIAEMTCIGSLLIIAIGLNMLKVTKIKIMNYILAVFLPILLCLFM